MVGTPRGPRSEDDLPQPMLSYTRSMVQPSQEWRFVGDYAIWTGNRLSTTELYQLYEQRGRKVLPIPPSFARAIMHPIGGQRWFHIERLFGFWMKADVDTVWIDAPGKDGHYYTLVVGGAETRPGSISTGWLCPSCGVVFNHRDYDVSKRRFQVFLDDMKLRVAEFNSSRSNRTCPNCGYVHPMSYGFSQQLLSPAQAVTETGVPAGHE